MTFALDNHRGDGAASVAQRDARRLWPHPLGEVFACGGRMLTLVETADVPGDLAALGQMLRRLKGRSILPVLDVRALSDGRVVAKTELPSGVSLAQRVACGPLEPARALGILRQVAQALANAWTIERGHGALSLSSVIVGIHDGRRDAVQVADFGLGDLAWVERDREASQLPLSPERALGLPRDAAEDAYLFGGLAFATLTGRPVFEATSVAEARRRHAIEDAPDLRDIPRGRDVPEPIRRFVARCLAKDPDERFAGGAELEAALCEAQLEAEIVTPWDDLPPPDVDPDRRHAIADALALQWSNECRREAAASGVFLAPSKGRHRRPKPTASVPSERARPAGVPRPLPKPDRTPIVETRLREPVRRPDDATPRPIAAEMDHTPVITTVWLDR